MISHNPWSFLMSRKQGRGKFSDAASWFLGRGRLWHIRDVGAPRIGTTLRRQAACKQEQNGPCGRNWGQVASAEPWREGWEWNRAGLQAHWDREAHRKQQPEGPRQRQKGRECQRLCGSHRHHICGLPPPERTDGMKACCRPSQIDAVCYGHSDLILCPDCSGKT